MYSDYKNLTSAYQKFINMLLLKRIGIKILGDDVTCV